MMVSPPSRGVRVTTMVRQQWFMSLCIRVGLVALFLLTTGSSVAVAALEKPAPQPLWKAFPLNPTGKRLGSIEQSPAQVRPKAARVLRVAESPTEESRPSVLVLALGGAALLTLALVAFASMRLLSVRNHRPGPTVWSSPSGSAGGLREPLVVQTSDVGLGVDRRTALHPDVAAPSYRLQRVGRKRFRRSRVAPRQRRVQLSRVFAEGFTGTARRIKHAAWNDQTAPPIVGVAIGICAAFLLVYWIG